MRARRHFFSWPNLAIYAALGLVGVWCARATGFPEAWDARISTRQRVLVPFVVGSAFGALAAGIDLITAGSKALAQVTGQTSFNIDFPGSLLAYSAGGILVEVEYRIFSLPFLLWLISGVLLRGRALTPTFWVLGVISAAFEPVAQGIFLFIAGGGVLTPVMLLGYMATALTLNALQVVFFRRYGLLAPIAARWGDYAVWHILYGNFLYGFAFPG